MMMNNQISKNITNNTGLTIFY